MQTVGGVGRAAVCTVCAVTPGSPPTATAATSTIPPAGRPTPDAAVRAAIVTATATSLRMQSSRMWWRCSLQSTTCVGASRGERLRR